MNGEGVADLKANYEGIGFCRVRPLGYFFAKHEAIAPSRSG